jgi:hypothetical protein
MRRIRMNQKRLQKLRRRAYEARIRGNSKMDEVQLLEALERVGQASAARSSWRAWSLRRSA